jgi:glutamate/tyrosine decarboxylase-like PLP-dependent enzyme
MSSLLKSVAERAINYQRNLDSRSVSPTPEALGRLAELDVPLQDDPTDAEEVIELLDRVGSPATVATAGGRYFGFVIGGSLPAAQAATWLTDVWDQNVCLRVMSPISAELEEIALGWLLDVLALPSGCGASFVTGATMANFTGLAAARHAVLKSAGWDVEAKGLYGAPEITVVVGEEAHATLIKALGLLGLGRERVVKVRTDEQGRMRADALPPLSASTIICLQAGNVNTGAFDPAEEICAAAHQRGAWVHIDGAFGMWAAAAPDRAFLTKGIGDADSWATDGHKWLNVPYDSGIAFVRNPQHLRAAMSFTAEYLPQGYSREPLDYTPEASRRARGVIVWAALRALGRKGLADLVEGTCRHAARFAEGLRDAGYQVLNDVVINQVLVSFGAAELTRRVIAAIQTDGTCWCSDTVWHGQVAMRISVSSWATTADDVERSLKAMVRIAREQEDLYRNTLQGAHSGENFSG